MREVDIGDRGREMGLHWLRAMLRKSNMTRKSCNYVCRVLFVAHECFQHGVRVLCGDVKGRMWGWGIGPR